MLAAAIASIFLNYILDDSKFIGIFSKNNVIFYFTFGFFELGSLHVIHSHFVTQAGLKLTILLL